MTNIRLAIRSLVKTPFVSLVAVVSLALGIGANTAIFSVFDQMLLSALPVDAPSELVNLEAPGPKPGGSSCNDAGDCESVFSYPMFRDLEEAGGPFTGLAAHRLFGANLSFQGETLNGRGMLVSGSYFSVLGLKPAIGRLLEADDDRNRGGHFVTVLSHPYWQTRFGARPDVLGQTMVVNGQSMTIVGVAQEGFQGTTLGSQPAVFVPITMRDQMLPGWEGFDDRRSYWAYVFGRLEPGVSIGQAEEAINVTYRAVIQEVEAPLQEGMSDQTLERFRAKRIALAPGAHGQSSMHDEARAPVLLLFGVTGIVLLIACANIANLLLARAANRGPELAVRLSIGAGRRHIIGQLLTESTLLGALGGMGGLLTARWTLGLIISLLPPEASQTLSTSLDARMLLFTAALAVTTGLLFGLVPALSSTRPNLVTSLRAAGGQTAGSRRSGWFRSALATAQMAMSMALLVAAGLFIKSLFQVSQVDLGLRSDHMATFSVSPGLNGYEPTQSLALFERIEEELAAIPGVSGATAAMVPLIAGSNWGSGAFVEGFEVGPDTDIGSSFNEVGPGFFKTLGIPLLAGREFTETDVIDAPKVAIVNETFARKFGLGREAVDKWMSTRRNAEKDIRIIGLVQDAKYSEVKDKIPPQFFLPYRQDDGLGSMNFYARSSIDTDEVLSKVQGVIASLDPNLPVEELKTLEEQVQESVVVDRVVGIFSSAFAVLATLLASVGLYGVLAYTVTQKTREYGLRMALGADAGKVRALVLGQVGRMAFMGGAVGLVVAIAIGRLASSMLYEIAPYDPVVLAVSAVLLITVAGAAALVPTWRASRIDPIRALRYE